MELWSSNRHHRHIHIESFSYGETRRFDGGLDLLLNFYDVEKEKNDKWKRKKVGQQKKNEVDSSGSLICMAPAASSSMQNNDVDVYALVFV